MKRTLMIATASLALCATAAQADNLRDALTQAYLNNPQLGAQRTDAQLAQEQLAQARAQGGVAVNLNASAGYQVTDTTSPFTFNVGERPIASASISASKPIYTGGRVQAGVRQAEAGIDAANAQLDAVGQSLFLQTVSSYVNVRRDEEAVRIRMRNVDVLIEQLRAARDRFDVGVVTRTDVALSEARLEGSRAALAGAQAQLEGSKAVYELLVGRPAENLEPPPPLPPLPASYEEAVAAARTLSPDLEASRAAEIAAREGVKVAQAASKPQVSIVGTASIQETYDPTQRDTSVSALAQGSIPLMDGGLRRSQVRSSKLRRAQAELNTAALDRRVVSDMAQAWYNYEASLRSIDASRRQVDAAEIAYEGAKEELAVGVRTTLDVLDQEQQLFEAQLAVIDAERNAYVAGHQLLRVIGVLTPEQMNIDADTYNPDDYGKLISRKWLLIGRE